MTTTTTTHHDDDCSLCIMRYAAEHDPDVCDCQCAGCVALLADLVEPADGIGFVDTHNGTTLVYRDGMLIGEVDL